MEPETIIRQALGDKYKIQSVIGKGGMATVYKAIQINLDRPVALKIVHQNLVHDDEFIKRFIREAQVCSSLNHPNIVTIHDIGSIGTVNYMAMEFLEGMTLRDMVQTHGNIGVEEIIDLIAPIAQALGYIHQRGIVHRDVKSSNIIITSDGRPVLMDFGIVYSEGKESLSQFGTVLGTPEYMSPEQAEGKVKIDGSTDIYSLGVVMFECLTGKLPYHSDNYLSTLVQVIHDNPPSVSSINPRLPEWINSIVNVCLVKDRTMRFSDGTALAKALKKKESPRIKGGVTVNDQPTRKIITKEIRADKALGQEEVGIQLQRGGIQRKSILVAIFMSLVVMLIILGVLILRPEKLQSNTGMNTGNTRVMLSSETITLPKISTSPIGGLKFNSANCGGYISDDGGSKLISRGVCWGKLSNPNIQGSHTNDGTGIGSFVSSITDLKPATLYYIRAYATNSFGTAYGEDIGFTTPSETNQNDKTNELHENIQTTNSEENYPPKITRGNVDDIEGNIYNTVAIGNQVWMAENLKTTLYNDGSPIELSKDNSDWYAYPSAKYCWYKNDEAKYKSKFGALYNWYAVNTNKLCPRGWHIPSKSDWTILTTYLGGVRVAGGKLKEKGSTYWATNNYGTTHNSGFMARAGGNRTFGGDFIENGYEGYWWSSTQEGKLEAWFLNINSNSSEALTYENNLRYGFSVRCVRNR